MAKRNKAIGPWRLSDRQGVKNHDGKAVAVVTVEVADMLDTKLGHRYTDSAYRVSVKSDLPGKPRAKTFYGELAWAAAERIAADFLWWAQVEMRKEGQ